MLLAMDTSQDNLNNKGTNCELSEIHSPLPQSFGPFIILRNNAQQEAHGPQCSPEKTVQINKHIWLYHNID